MSKHWPDNTPFDHRRLVHRLVRYWQELAGTNAMPEENDIDPDALGADWDFCFVLQARDLRNIIDYNFTYLGDAIRRAYNDRNAFDHYNESMIGPNANCLSIHFERVLDSGAPVIDEGEFLNLHGRKVLYRQCMLPLGNADKGVEAIFGGMNYKIEE